MSSTLKHMLKNEIVQRLYILVTVQAHSRFLVWRPDFKASEAEHVRSDTCSMQEALKDLGTRSVSEEVIELEPV